MKRFKLGFLLIIIGLGMFFAGFKFCHLNNLDGNGSVATVSKEKDILSGESVVLGQEKIIDSLLVKLNIYSEDVNYSAHGFFRGMDSSHVYFASVFHVFYSEKSFRINLLDKKIKKDGRIKRLGFFLNKDDYLLKVDSFSDCALVVVPKNNIPKDCLEYISKLTEPKIAMFKHQKSTLPVSFVSRRSISSTYKNKEQLGSMCMWETPWICSSSGYEWCSYKSNIKVYGGDSGSPVYTKDRRAIVGLVSGGIGDSFHSHISPIYVLEEMYQEARKKLKILE